MGYHTERMAGTDGGGASGRRGLLMGDPSQGFPELLVAYTRLMAGLVEQRPRATVHSLRLSAEGAALAGGHGQSGYWGHLASAPFFRCLPRFHFSCESDGS